MDTKEKPAGNEIKGNVFTGGQGGIVIRVELPPDGEDATAAMQDALNRLYGQTSQDAPE